MEYVTEFIILVTVLGAGILTGKYLAPGVQRIKELETLLAEEKSHQQKYKDNVAEHFSVSANLFGDITEKYRSLYEHMSSGAYQLCDRRNIPRELSVSHVNILAVETPEVSPQLTDDGIPLSTSEQSSDDLIVDVSRAGLSPLDSTSQLIAKQSKQHKSKTAEIIDLDSQRNDDRDNETDLKGVPTEQAKDYAIKAKGVINHNSLNRDDVSS